MKRRENIPNRSIVFSRINSTYIYLNINKNTCLCNWENRCG